MTEEPNAAAARTRLAVFWSVLTRGTIGLALPYVLANAISGAFTIAGIVVLTRLMSADGYGTAAYVLATATLLQNASFFWIQASILRFAAPARTTRADNLAGTLLAFFAATLLATICWIAVNLIPTAAVPDAGLWLAGWALLLLRGVLTLVQAWHRADDRPWRYLLLEALNSGGGMILGILALWVWPGQPAALIAGYAAGATLACLTVQPSWHWRSAGGFARMKAFAGYGAPLALTSLSGTILALSDRLLIGAFLGPAQVAIYSLGYAVADRFIGIALQPIPSALKRPMFAAYERDGAAGVDPVLRTNSIWLLRLGLPLTTVLICAPQLFADLLIGGGMAVPAARIIPWVAAGSLFSSLAALHAHLAFQLSRRTSALILVTTLPAALNLALNVLLLPRFGIGAAAQATAGCYLLLLVLSMICGRHHVRVRFGIGDVAKAAIPCLALAAFLEVGSQRGILGWVQLGTGLVSYAGCTAALSGAVSLTRTARHTMRIGR